MYKVSEALLYGPSETNRLMYVVCLRFLSKGSEIVGGISATLVIPTQRETKNILKTFWTPLTNFK